MDSPNKIMNNEQLQQHNQMFEWYQQMQKSSTIPRSTETALRDRGIGIELFNSTALPSSYDQVTSAGGGDTVPKLMDGFKKTAEGILIPYYNPI